MDVRILIAKMNVENIEAGSRNRCSKPRQGKPGLEFGREPRTVKRTCMLIYPSYDMAICNIVAAAVLCKQCLGMLRIRWSCSNPCRRSPEGKHILTCRLTLIECLALRPLNALQPRPEEADAARAAKPITEIEASLFGQCDPFQHRLCIYDCAQQQGFYL